MPEVLDALKMFGPLASDTLAEYIERPFRDVLTALYCYERVGQVRRSGPSWAFASNTPTPPERKKK